MRIANGIVTADDGTMPVRVVGVRALPGHRLWLRYADGEERIFDATPLLTTGVFTRLADEAAFAGVGLDFGVPTWPEAEVDLSPEYIYQESVAATPAP